MKTILITGAAGFIGSNLVHHIIENTDWHVVSFDKLTYAGNLQNLAAFENDPRHKFIKGDIADAALVTETLNTTKPDAIIHLAAETHVDRSIAEAEPFLQTNVLGHTCLLRAAQDYYEAAQNKDFRFLHISTDEVFGSLQDTDPPFTETSPYNPRSPYAASKAAGDHLTRAWHNTYGLPAIILHPSNNFGPRQHPEKLIPLIISKTLQGEELPVYGDGKNIRDWLCVTDHCAAILAALEKGTPGQSYCIGGGNERRNIDLVKTICAILDDLQPRTDKAPYEKQITFVKDRPGHDHRYAVDSQKARAQLNWEPVQNFEDYLCESISWYLKNTQ